MKLFTKLALVSAVAMSANAMAMQSMDDADLSATTGQDGISIGIGISAIAIDKVNVFDGDGLATTAQLADGLTATTGTPIVGGTGKAGAITVNDIRIGPNTNSLLASHNLADLTIDTDAGAGGTKPFLNIGAAVSGLNISLGKIDVNSATQDATTKFYTADTTNSATILNGLTLTTGKTAANIQLGNTPQGAMIKLAGSMIGGLTISDLALHDASTGGGDVYLGKIHLNDTGSADLSTNADIAVTQNGLAVTAMTNKTDMYIQTIGLGGYTPAVKDASGAVTTAAVIPKSIGDVQISGMRVFNGATGTTPGAVITISGH